MKKILNTLSRQEGFSFVEVMVALVIFSVTIISFSAFFASGIQNIFTTGHKGSALYNAQENMENTIASEDYFSDEVKPIKGPLELSFPTAVKVEGYFITKNETYTDAQGNEHTVTVTTFVPKR